jgi:hypothetical protein
MDTDVFPEGMPHWARQKFISYRRSAIERGYGFDLDPVLFWGLLNSPCHYCRGTHERGAVIGIDRRDNNVGYTEGNVVSACGVCNNAKSVMSEAAFVAWVRQATETTATWEATTVDEAYREMRERRGEAQAQRSSNPIQLLVDGKKVRAVSINSFAQEYNLNPGAVYGVAYGNHKSTMGGRITCPPELVEKNLEARRVAAQLRADELNKRRSLQIRARAKEAVSTETEVLRGEAYDTQRREATAAGEGPAEGHQGDGRG